MNLKTYIKQHPDPGALAWVGLWIVPVLWFLGAFIVPWLVRVML